MASLQVAKYAGAVAALAIPDGPPVACKSIAAGAGGVVYGSDTAPVICELAAIGGDVAITWAVAGVTETLSQGAIAVRLLRGEAVSVA